MSVLNKRPWRRLGRATAGVVSLAVVTTSMVALAAAGSADASPRATTARPDAAGVQAVRGAALSATSVFDRAAKYTSSISGTDARDRNVTGRFVPGRAFVKDGAMFVQGHVFVRIYRADGTSFVRDQTGVQLPATFSTPGTNSAAAPLAAAVPTTCPVLHLELGPLDLNLLGLAVHLDKVVLDITAIPGAGNLLGNLLCAVAGLLDGTPLGGLLGQLSDLLTQIFAILRA
jgi:hypothetical protein